jgi:hypothetical protein
MIFFPTVKPLIVFIFIRFFKIFVGGFFHWFLLFALWMAFNRSKWNTFFCFDIKTVSSSKKNINFLVFNFLVFHFTSLPHILHLNFFLFYLFFYFCSLYSFGSVSYHYICLILLLCFIIFLLVHFLSIFPFPSFFPYQFYLSVCHSVFLTTLPVSFLSRGTKTQNFGFRGKGGVHSLNLNLISIFIFFFISMVLSSKAEKAWLTLNALFLCINNQGNCTSNSLPSFANVTFGFFRPNFKLLNVKCLSLLY